MPDVDFVKSAHSANEFFRSFITSSCKPFVSIGCDSSENKYYCTQFCNELTTLKTCQEYNTQAQKCNEGVVAEMNTHLENCFIDERRKALNEICIDIKSIFVPMGLDHQLILNNSTISQQRYFWFKNKLYNYFIGE